MQIVGIIVFALCFLFMADIGIIIDFLFTTIIEKIFPDKEESETKVFRGSLVYYGLRGGALYVDNENITYKNQTTSIPDEFKNLVIPLKKIVKVEKTRAMFMPAVVIHLSKYQSYKFVIFNRPKFLKLTDPLYVDPQEETENGHSSK